MKTEFDFFAPYEVPPSLNVLSVTIKALISRRFNIVRLFSRGYLNCFCNFMTMWGDISSSTLTSCVFLSTGERWPRWDHVFTLLPAHRRQTHTYCHQVQKSQGHGHHRILRCVLCASVCVFMWHIYGCSGSRWMILLWPSGCKESQRQLSVYLCSY